MGSPSHLSFSTRVDSGRARAMASSRFHVPHATSLWSERAQRKRTVSEAPDTPIVGRFAESARCSGLDGHTLLPRRVPRSILRRADRKSTGYPAPLYARESDASTCRVCRSFAGPCRQCPRGRVGRSGGARLGLLVRLHEFARHNWRARVRRDEAREVDAHGDHRGWFVGARLVHRHGRREHELGMLLRAGGRAAGRRRSDRRHGLQPRPGRGSARGVLHGDRRTGGAASRPRVDDGSAACSRPRVDDDPAT